MSHDADPLSHAMHAYKCRSGSGIYRRSDSTFVHPTATIGGGSILWHFSLILADVRIGADVSVGSVVEIGARSTIGDRSRISRGVFLPNASIVGERVFIGPNVTFTDDRFPQVLEPGQSYVAEPPVIEDGAMIGAGAVICPGVRIGRGALIAAGSIISTDVPPFTQMRGEPARARPSAAVMRG